MKKIYIAGPYSKGDVAINVKKAMDAANYLIEREFAPFCPHLTHFLHLANPQPYHKWLELDLIFLPLCDALLRLPGDSSGADGEVKHAISVGVPVFYSFPSLLNYYGLVP